MPDFSYEQKYGRNEGKIICGVDEVGRGPLAGPVVAAAAIIPLDFPELLASKIRDSKKMSAAAREKIFLPLTQSCKHSIAQASIDEIDSINILQASLLAMHRAIEGLQSEVDIALIDGNKTPKTSCKTLAIVKGDDKSMSIAVASIIAKVHRDRIMSELAAEHPHYGWERNAGYGTKEHIAALTNFGVTKWHRTSFEPVRIAMKK